MDNGFFSMPWSKRWWLLVNAAKRGAEEMGYTLHRVPGRGLSNVWKLEKDGHSVLAAIRTTQDRWIAFAPLANGAKWKTLDDVALVLVAAVDSIENPQNIETYIFPSNTIRNRFDAAYAARAAAGHTNRDDFGMWVALDQDPRGLASSVGSGIVEEFDPVATYPMSDPSLSRPQLAEDAEDRPIGAEAQEIQTGALAGQPETIAEVMAWARKRVAELAGLRLEAVRLDLKLEY
jgi:hypothetical protein